MDSSTEARESSCNPREPPQPAAGPSIGRPLKEEKTETYYPDDSKRCPQPSSEELASFGIKIRDFTYESKLPPIRPYKRLRPDPLQIQRQPDPRTWHGLAGVGINGEPSQGPSRGDDGLARQRGFTDLDDYEFSKSQQSHYSPSSQAPLEYITSQESEPFIETPIVTPNGSLQWKDTSHMPTAELDVLARMSVSDILGPKPLLGKRPYQSSDALPRLYSPDPEPSTTQLASETKGPTRPTKKQRISPPESPSPLKRGNAAFRRGRP